MGLPPKGSRRAAAASPALIDAQSSTHERAWLVVLIAGVVIIATDTMGLLGSLSPVVLPGLAAMSIVATVLGIRWNQPRLKYPWWLVCAGLGFFLVGGVFREIHHTLGDLTPHRSLLPDVITIPGYVVGAAGLFALARVRRLGAQGAFDIMLDGLVASLACLVLAWVYVITPTLVSHHIPLAIQAALVVYPSLSAFLVAVAAAIAFSPDKRSTPAYRAVLLMMALLLLGDLIYMFAEAGRLIIPLRFLDVAYAGSFTAMAVTVLHPSMRQLCETVEPDQLTPTRGRLVLVSVALAVPAFVVVGYTNRSQANNFALGGIILALTVAVVLRVSRALRDHARASAQLVHQATHDPLTGLPNRVVANDVLGQALRDSDVDAPSVAVLFVDLDRFKLVNDTLGHATGDELLVAVGNRLRDNCDPDDLVARVGGDEFVVILNKVQGVDDALEQAERLRLCFQVPFLFGEREIFASASFGVAVADRESYDAEDIIRDADVAMYQAKEAGRNGITVFDVSHRARAEERLALDHDLRHALEREELRLEFQPIVHLPGGPILGFEALLRWAHPTRGLIPPSVFIPVAEDTDVIIEIGNWILRETCRHLSRWRNDPERPEQARLYVAVNLSARQLGCDDLIETVEDLLVEFGLPGDALCLELTESLLIHNPDMAAQRLTTLRSLDVRLSIDDFGTGYSSLSYLKRFPVNYVKIDRSFIDGLRRPDTSDETLVAAIIAMAAALGMSTVAEGIETRVQESRLRGLGCTLGQGYLYSKSVPPSLVPALVSELANQPVTLPDTEFRAIS